MLFYASCTLTSADTFYNSNDNDGSDIKWKDDFSHNFIHVKSITDIWEGYIMMPGFPLLLEAKLLCKQQVTKWPAFVRKEIQLVEENFHYTLILSPNFDTYKQKWCQWSLISEGKIFPK